MDIAKPSKPVSLVENVAETYGPALKAYFRRHASDSVEAEDLTQEVYLSLARSGGGQAIHNMDGYVFTIASNLVRSRGRTQAVRPRLVSEGSQSHLRLVDELSPERRLLSAEALEMLLKAVGELPQRTRTIFVLNRFEEMSARQIAAHLNLSVSLIEKEMMKALAHLNKRLKR